MPASPAIPSLIWKDPTRIRVSWLPPDSGGSPILGFMVYMKLSTNLEYSLVYDGSNDPNVTFSTITMLNNLNLTNNTYDIIVRARNIVGYGAYSGSLTVNLTSFPSSKNTIVTGIENILSNYPTTVKLQVK